MRRPPHRSAPTTDWCPVPSSGETQVSVNFARIAKDEGARVLALTQNPASTLAEIADVVMPIPTIDTQQFGGSLFEQVCLLILDSVVYQIAADTDGAFATMQHRHTNMQ